MESKKTITTDASILDSLTTVDYVQTTKSREAYEAQQLAFLHRPFASSASRRSRPLSASAAGSWNGSRDRPGSGAKDNGFPNPPPYPPPVYHRSSSPGIVGGGGGRGKGASFDHLNPPPPFVRDSENSTPAAIAAAAAAAPNGTGTRLGKPRTRVRPSSANARVYGTPGAGQGVGGGRGGGGGSSDDGGGRSGSGADAVPRRVHVPLSATGYGDDGKVMSTNSNGQASVFAGCALYRVVRLWSQFCILI